MTTRFDNATFFPTTKKKLKKKIEIENNVNIERTTTTT
jgi:hypothetical protein